MDLIFPVVNQGGRGDDETSFLFPLLKGRKEKSDDLQSFSKAHIVCQDSAEAVLTEGFQPEKAFLLVRPQDFFQGLGELEIAVLHAFHVSDQALIGALPFHGNALFFFELLIQVEGPVARRLDLAFFQRFFRYLQGVEHITDRI